MGKEISLMRDQKEDYQYEEAIKTLNEYSIFRYEFTGHHADQRGAE